LLIEYIIEALDEDERQDDVLVFGRILGPVNGAGGVPDPGFDEFVIDFSLRRLSVLLPYTSRTVSWLFFCLPPRVTTIDV
jgi:hypothetical protein